MFAVDMDDGGMQSRNAAGGVRYGVCSTLEIIDAAFASRNWSEGWVPAK